MNNPWKVKFTSCFPNKWKVIPNEVYLDTNGSDNYFFEEMDAQTEANERNKIHNKPHSKNGFMRGQFSFIIARNFQRR